MHTAVMSWQLIHFSFVLTVFTPPTIIKSKMEEYPWQKNHLNHTSIRFYQAKCGRRRNEIILYRINEWLTVTKQQSSVEPNAVNWMWKSIFEVEGLFCSNEFRKNNYRKRSFINMTFVFNLRFIIISIITFKRRNVWWIVNAECWMWTRQSSKWTSKVFRWINNFPGTEFQ